MKVRRISTWLSVGALALVTACSTSPRRANDPYAGAPAYPAQPVYSQQPVYNGQPAYPQSNAYPQYGQVRSIEVVPLETRTSGGGAVLGAVLGAVVGHQIGSGTGRGVATGLGAVGGAVAGNAIEKRNRRDAEVYRVSVRFEDGSVRDFDYQQIGDLRVGDRVKWEGGQLMVY